MNGPRWAVQGMPSWTLLIWLPLCYSLALASAVDEHRNIGPVTAGITATVAGLAFTGAVLTRFRRGPRLRVIAYGLLTLLAGLALFTTIAWSPAWGQLFVLLAVAVGTVVLDRRAPWLLLAVTAASAAAVALSTGEAGPSTGVASVAITTGLAGLGTYAVYQLYAVIGELRCTQDELARLAVSAERERFARDLHDMLGHTLSVIVVKAEAVRRLAVVDGAAAADHAGDIETIGREALTDIRHAVSGYRGAGLERELGRARSALEAAGVGLTVHRDWERPLPEETDEILGWVVREGVTNVIRHARAQACTVSLVPAAGGVRLTIEDVRADPDAGRDQDRPAGGVGLIGLRERVSAGGGQLVTALSGTGFALSAELPVVTAGASSR
jgi:two-component system, NarL family, sensor histidine kinase DesK